MDMQVSRNVEQPCVDTLACTRGTGKQVAKKWRQIASQGKIYAWVHCISVNGNGLTQEALNFRQWNDFIPDSVRSAKLAALQKPVDGDVRDAQNVRRLAHCICEPGQGVRGFVDVLRV
jgi:hypothetical protein